MFKGAFLRHNCGIESDLTINSKHITTNKVHHFVVGNSGTWSETRITTAKILA